MFLFVPSWDLSSLDEEWKLCEKPTVPLDLFWNSGSRSGGALKKWYTALGRGGILSPDTSGARNPPGPTPSGDADVSPSGGRGAFLSTRDMASGSAILLTFVGVTRDWAKTSGHISAPDLCLLR
ncbi:hypothetical protein MG293_010020 [Ovis ammon polii]|uniref:Uncharacterized protein n=1 Tax=Ovis ammon polii TaxID=230172 RepID=A0AAD4U8Q9_OVIAM|nr:hypothetical protein MG293_010020 [Ovis ammon polii]